MFKVKGNSKGVTMMILIVTIIVILILAGITVHLIKDDEGIINKTENAVSSYYISDKKENIEDAYADLLTKL